MAEETLFTRIMKGEIPADVIYEDDLCICIRDIAPKAPVHVLLIPRKPVPRLADASEADQELLGHLMTRVGVIARQLGIEDAFRVIVNNGEGAGQTVFHLHLHILGNKEFSEAQLGF
ncbi:histidine triad nucleotide-binding protein [Gilvimarinus sp. F26214L]|uniref:histidine triad nucleotide-binding protein n=1 Tax=Gilvimarinus sp. DZF01 TaxID=3461371 RepID=UPI00404575BC